MVVPFFVGRKKSILAVDEAMTEGKIIFLATQKNLKTDSPGKDDIFTIGTISKILQVLKLPDGSLRLLVEGLERAIIAKFCEGEEPFKVQVKAIKENAPVTIQLAALIQAVKKEFARYCAILKKIPIETIQTIDKIEDPHKLIDAICANSPLKIEKRVELLTITNTKERLETMAVVLAGEKEVLDMEHRINNKIKKKLEQNQKQYFLNEQLKEIQKELGTDADDPSGVKELEKLIGALNLPEQVFTKVDKDVKRLARLQPMSPESGVLRTYLEWITDLPWDKTTHDSKDIESAEKILDEDHYDLKKVKERILDFIAVRQLKEHVKGPILCFVGPPGTGKTSLGRSVAKALGRKFVRISLGGVRDEAEIRGHRKTYIGALPGKIIQSLKKAETNNPVFLLDEIDKMNSDYKGDPASALLEVLDPEQNSTFLDHYLEVQYDLSRVMFITTANSVHNIPYPLLDRMEIIEVSGYTEFEKEKIAEKFLIPKQIEENGLSWAHITIQRSAILKVIRNYTMESGVRNLERKVASILRKIARDVVKKGYAEPGEHEPYKVVVTAKSLVKYLGKERFKETQVAKVEKAGLANGLAWTELGGTLLPVEAAILEGKGELLLTGNLGEVMKESARIALSFLRSHIHNFNVNKDFYKDKDIHIHVPEGAIPKDGPSAGITLTAALLSAISGIKIKKKYAMTGEITLTDRLLPIGGVKEKLLAAHRNNMTHVLMPEDNRKDLEDLPQEVLNSLDFIFTDSVVEALYALFPAEIRADFSAPLNI